MKKLSLYIFLVLIWCNVGYAKSLFYEKYKNNPDNVNFIEHLKSVESGMSWMQVYSKNEVYCKPSELLINEGNLSNAVKLGVKDLESRNFSNQEIDDFPVELIMLAGLKILFTCS
jgi:hypothetical protein